MNVFHYLTVGQNELQFFKNKTEEIKPAAQFTEFQSLCEIRCVLRHEAVKLFDEFIKPVVSVVQS